MITFFDENLEFLENGGTLSLNFILLRIGVELEDERGVSLDYGTESPR